MPRRVEEPNRFLTLGNDLRVVAVPGPQPKRPRPRGRRFAARASQNPNDPPPSPPLAPPYLRHRALIMAALRVWELRHGIHEAW